MVFFRDEIVKYRNVWDQRTTSYLKRLNRTMELIEDKLLTCQHDRNITKTDISFLHSMVLSVKWRLPLSLRNINAS